MGVLQKKSVGEINYVLIDDMYPVFSGENGTVAISTLGGVFTCETGYTWSTYTNKNIGAEIYAFNHNDGATFLPPLDTWQNFNGVASVTTYVLTSNSSGFTLTLASSAPRLNVSDDNIGRFMSVSNNTFRATGAQWNQIRCSPARNNVEPVRYQTAHFGTLAQNDSMNILTPVLFTGSARNNDYFFAGFYVDSRETGSASLNRPLNKVSVDLIEQPVTFNERGNSLDFTKNGWVTVNDSTNRWFMGTGTTFSGGGTSIYISNDNGVTPSYNNTISQVSHFYKDITFPKNLQSNVTIEFFWVGSGQTGLDYGKVYLSTTDTTPVAGTQVSPIFSIGNSNYQGVTSFTGNTIIIPRYNAIDQTKRLIFSWINNGDSLGSTPPFCIDSFRMSYYVDDNWYEVVTGDTETFNLNGFSGNGWTVVNNATNIWTVGVSEFSGTNDNYSAYITNANNTTYYGSEFNNSDNRALAQYTTGTAQVSHFYKDFTFTSASTLTFNWKCWGENGTGNAINYDYGAIVITTTGTTPVAGTEVSTVQATAGGNGRIGATTNLGKFNEGYGGSDNNWRTETINLGSYSGQTKRLVFTWKNDGSVGANPPFVVDNIRITGVGNWATRLNKIN